MIRALGIFVLLLCCVVFSPTSALAQTPTPAAAASADPQPTPRTPEDTRGFDTAPVPDPSPNSKGVHFAEHLREHSGLETSAYVGSLYAVNILGYIATQQPAIHSEGSWQTYRYNLFKVVRADYDTWNYNWGTHVLTGATVNLFYRSRGYSRVDAFLLTALQSALFEFTIEVYSEPASLEDLINTPVLGTIAGTFLEWASFSLLNTDSWILHGFGHILNPFTLFGLHEGEIKVTPTLDKDQKGIAFQWRF